jgi:hypothetical protein
VDTLRRVITTPAVGVPLRVNLLARPADLAPATARA